MTEGEIKKEDKKPSEPARENIDKNIRNTEATQGAIGIVLQVREVYHRLLKEIPDLVKHEELALYMAIEAVSVIHSDLADRSKIEKLDRIATRLEKITDENN